MSTDTVTKQVPVNGTVQVKVAPGSQTGLYYILISNLPWNTSWQQLKDHVRTVCPVERVEVFNDSTSGWVMVRGRDNYDEALQLLSGGLFNGRPTFADGRNATQSIYIKELVAPSNTTVSSPQTTHASSKTQQAPPPMVQNFNGSPQVSPHATSDYGGQWASVVPAGAYVTSPTADYLPRTMNMPYDYGEPPAWYSYDAASNSYVDQSPVVSPMQYSYDAVYQQPQQCYDEYYGHDYSSPGNAAVQEPRPSKSGRTNGNADSYVQTEKRKIIIKGLASWTSKQQASELVRSKAGSDADKIQRIDLPEVRGGQSIRGYATVTFRSEEAAIKVIKRLNGYKLDGRTLKAEYTKEGVSKSEDHHGKSSHHHSHKHQREERPKHEKKESFQKENSKASGSHSSEKKDKSQSKKDVVIANGSSKKAVEQKSK